MDNDEHLTLMSSTSLCACGCSPCPVDNITIKTSQKKIQGFTSMKKYKKVRTPPKWSYQNTKDKCMYKKMRKLFFDINK